MSILVAFIRCTRVAWEITTPAHFSTDENGGGHSNQNLRTFSDETPVILERLSIACYSMVSYLSQHWLIDNGLARNWQAILRACENPVLRSIFAYISQKELTHYDDVIMAWWRLKSPASRFFIQQFIRAQIKENITKFRVAGLCARNSPGTGEFLAQMASNAENVSIWWRHHGGAATSSVTVSRVSYRRMVYKI